ncbi:MAG: BTAD domain-containing putative transcriptional regulator, partial [Acidimicrobiia bacterium]
MPRNLGGRRQRTVLAVLLAHANAAVAQDALIDAVWAGEPPEAGRQTLHSYVSILRKSLGGQIDREAEGYVLRVDRFNLDALRFRDAVTDAAHIATASPLEALVLLEEGLGLWRGPAYGDLADEPAIMTEAVALEEARLAALEQRIELDLILGNHNSVVQELEALTMEHPFREHLRFLHMLALYRSGRQGDALRAFQTTRSFLGEQLGIDPSPELQGLEERILMQDPSLDWKGGQHSGGGRVDRAARGYELHEAIGVSRWGKTYRGFQRAVGREVNVLAIDQTIAGEMRFIRRFDSDMQLVSRLDHPHLSPIYDFWRDPEGAFVVTPHFRGGTLRHALTRGKWNLSSTVRLVDQLSSALTYAHRAGVTHGGMSPDNIFLDEDLNGFISELGLAELAHGESASPQRDTYDLARVAAEILTGTDVAPAERLSEIQPDLIALDDVFLKAGHPDPASRYQKPDDLRRAIRQAAGIDVVTVSGPVETAERRNPYKGLRAFHEPDAADFYGREGVVEELIRVLSAKGMVTVVGPSGSGKSSLVRAGLVPAIRKRGLPGSQNWLITEMFPGSHPYEELEAALMRVATNRPVDVFAQLTSDDRGLVRVAKQLLEEPDDHLILIIDQFEELFSLVSSDTTRDSFLASILA